jgi:hypothetical protein
MNFTSLLNWFIRSSQDPKKFSLTIKSALLALITILATLGYDTSSLPEGVDLIVTSAEQTLIFTSTVLTLIGFFRKVKITRLGKNELWK